MRVVIVAAALFMTGCATGYQRDGLTGGFTESQLSENVWRVTFNGNGYTSEDRAQDMALLRSAELTLANGYSHFILADERSTTEVDVGTTPVTSTTTGSAYVYGNSIQGRATTQTFGGQSYTIRRPSTRNSVVMLKEKPVDGRYVAYDARFICTSLGAKYQVQCSGPAK